jgi:hypothetical protein
MPTDRAGQSPSVAQPLVFRPRNRVTRWPLKRLRGAFPQGVLLDSNPQFNVFYWILTHNLVYLVYNVSKWVSVSSFVGSM